MAYRMLLPVLALLLVACVPGAGDRSGAAPAASSSPKILLMGSRADDEPRPADGGMAFDASEAGHILHSALTFLDDRGEPQPWIAERVPTVENGDWKVFPDERMEVTWKLRPNVLWHDGTSLTAEDFVFGFKVGTNPEVAARGTAVLRQIDGLNAPDPHTLTVRWKNIYFRANEMGPGSLAALPRHLLAPLYDAGNIDAFTASPYLMTEWIGVGPYRVGEWLQGVSTEAIAFDQYFLGRPKIDRISIRWFGDVNVLMASIMAGEVDVVARGAFKLSEAATLQADWAAAGRGTVILSHGGLRGAQWNWRDPAAPWVRDVRVRQALAHMTDRRQIGETIFAGLTAELDIPLPSQSAAFRLAQQRGLPRYDYDVTQAHRLLGEAGLTRGSDGTFRSQGGEPFAIEVGATADIQTNVQVILAIADQWKRAGVGAVAFPIPDPSTDKDMVRSNVKGVVMNGCCGSEESFRQFTTSEASSEANRWRGRNFGGHSNPVFDEQYNRLLRTISASDRAQIAADLATIVVQQVVIIPVHLDSDVAAHKKGVRGPSSLPPGTRAVSWNVHLWDIG